jgi:hypothetical protein
MGALRNAVNPFSTAFSRWWCHSSLRAIAGGKPRNFYRSRGPGLRRTALRRTGSGRTGSGRTGSGRTGSRSPVEPEPMDPQVRQDRIDAIEQILGADRED